MPFFPTILKQPITCWLELVWAQEQGQSDSHIKEWRSESGIQFATAHRSEILSCWFTGKTTSSFTPRLQFPKLTLTQRPQVCTRTKANHPKNDENENTWVHHPTVLRHSSSTTQHVLLWLVAHQQSLLRPSHSCFNPNPFEPCDHARELVVSLPVQFWILWELCHNNRRYLSYFNISQTFTEGGAELCTYLEKHSGKNLQRSVNVPWEKPNFASEVNSSNIVSTFSFCWISSHVLSSITEHSGCVMQTCWHESIKRLFMRRKICKRYSYWSCSIDGQ